ncbi:hypothetical protein QTH87_22530 [Variovorax sp. J22P168]|uniref:hypothetical protein n=1 Tax=Variovorax jilinensis TaxID=3053513 RepID=UPI002575EEC8|nr:hypothetical protein [Variovorax sp. J22P168]MDM0015239.1 hypothetical protein [Variovorax sp. J22P168]
MHRVHLTNLNAAESFGTCRASTGSRELTRRPDDHVQFQRLTSRKVMPAFIRSVPLLGLLVGGLWLSAPDRAEARAMHLPAKLAVRWHPEGGGPQTVTEVVQLLELARGTSATFEVSLLSVDLPGGPDPGLQMFKVERSTSSGWRSTYEIRATEGHQKRAAFQQWRCPLTPARRIDVKLDLGWVSEGAPVVGYFRGCDSNSSAAQPSTAPRATTSAGCMRTVQRWTSGHVKVEHWRIQPGMDVLEVSLEASSKPVAVSDFRDHVVRPLLDQGIQPLDHSTLELASRC